MKLLISICLIFSVAWASCNSFTTDAPKADTTALVVRPQGVTPPLPDKNMYAPVDVSPMDMAYFPPNYPQQKMIGSLNDPPIMRIIYSRPHLQGRNLFHDILHYGEPWRLGANEATELQVYEPISFDGKKLPKGRYTLYCIPQQNQWTVAVNKNVDTWGLTMDSTKDLIRVTAPVTSGKSRLEFFTIVFEKGTGKTGTLLMGWEDVEVRLPFSY